jgi:hypothetical protein
LKPSEEENPAYIFRAGSNMFLINVGKHPQAHIASQLRNQQHRHFHCYEKSKSHMSAEVSGLKENNLFIISITK